MPAVAVLEPAPVLAPLLARTLPPSLAVLTDPARLGSGQCGPAWESAPDWECAPHWEAAPAMVVLGPEQKSIPVPCPPCRILLTPGPPGDAPSVVSYGPSPRDTLTFSSLRAGGMVLALQRELVTLAGRRVERQELALPCRGDPLLTLAWAGALLLAGTEPEALAALAGLAFR